MAPRLRPLLAGISALALLVYATLALMRCAHPFELEWEEGGMLQQVGRVLHGTPLYAEPSLEYMALPYTPLYVLLGAASAKLFGSGFLALRLVSLLSSFVCLGLIFRCAARHGGGPFAGLFAAGLYAASYRFCGAWFDVARVDSLFLAFVLGALEVLELGSGLTGIVIGGVLFFGAFLAKQTAIVPAGFVLLALLVRERRSALVFVLAFGLPLAGSTFFAGGQSGSWYRWYVFDLLRGHPWEQARIAGFWIELLGALAPVAGLAVLAHFRGAQAGAVPARAPILPFLVAGLLAAAWISRVHVGGYDNALMPACAAAALVFGPALARALEASTPVALAAAVLALGQFWLLRYDPRAQLPTADDLVAGEALVADLRAVEGEVWIPDHGYLAERAGKRALAHGMALIDLLQSSDSATARRVSDELTRALAEKRFAVIVLDQDWDADLPLLAQNYARRELAYVDARTFVPVTGDARRPRYWYARR